MAKPNADHKFFEYENNIVYIPTEMQQGIREDPGHMITEDFGRLVLKGEHSIETYKVGDTGEFLRMSVTPIKDKMGRSMRIMSFAVTQRLYEAVMGNNPSSNKLSASERLKLQLMTEEGDQIPDLPVVDVSLIDASFFANALSKACGFDAAYTMVYNAAKELDNIVVDYASNGFRLPQVDEWRAAAFAGRETKFAGSDIATEVGWVAENSGQRMHVVGELKPNDWGIYDMTGNAWEWLGTRVVNS